MFKLPVVGCSVLYVLRFAGGPDGNIPRTFGWIGSIKKKTKKKKFRKQAYIHLYSGTFKKCLMNE